jgi:hypothetical protein
MDIAQEAPQTVILPEDEASLYLQATTQSVWAPRGQTPVVRVHLDRKKVSFYGTLNLKTGDALGCYELSGLSTTPRADSGLSA